jgi:hypothetical protein
MGMRKAVFEAPSTAWHTEGGPGEAVSSWRSHQGDMGGG